MVKNNFFREQLFKNIEKAELQIPKFVSDDAANLLRAVKILKNLKN